MANNSKRKMWKGCSTSSEEKSSSPTDKKLKFNTFLTEFEAFSETYEAVSGVNMADSALTAQSLLPKRELVLQKLSNLEFKFDSIEKYVKAVNDKVSNLEVKVERFEEFGKETVLERLNFGEYFVQWIKTFYTDISSLSLIHI